MEWMTGEVWVFLAALVAAGSKLLDRRKPPEKPSENKEASGGKC